ncbi:hypothetical protein MNBD_GAMMA09-3730 [hydrothermal vent metagenome]|uniref:Uncharacterized protein n=1 Tax=hydrothermal vent metagenome TaxID=652676 RepID=A0A3B0XH78_9ZZZZ
MDRLKKTFGSLVEKHKDLIKQVGDKSNQERLAVADVFSIEPFYHQLHTISSYDFEFYTEASLIPAGYEKLICHFGEDGILQIRNEYREETYYDNFFIYHENEKWRLQLFVNGNDVKPTNVERLILDSEGNAVSYETYDGMTYTRFSYDYQEAGVIQKRYDDKDNLLETNELIFKDNIKPDIKSVVDQVILIIVDTVMKGLQSDGIYLEEDNEEPIECILLQYTAQGPFPPLVAMSPEVSLKKGEYPFYFYSANDMKHELFLDFSAQNCSVMDDLNFYFENKMHDIECDVSDKGHIDEVLKIEAEIFDIYVGICRKIKAKRKLASLIPVTKTFHVTARDFERCNEWDFLQATVSKSRLKIIQKQLDSYNNADALSIEKRALMENFNATLDEENKAYDCLKEKLKATSVNVKYSQHLHYHLEPYAYELRYNKPHTPGLLINNERLSLTPENKKHYKYHFDGDSLCFISYYDGDRLLNEMFFTYDDDTTSVHNFHHADSGLYLQEFDRMEYKKTKPNRLMSYKFRFLEETNFEFNNNGRLLSARMTSTFIHHPRVESTTSNKFYSYDKSGEMVKITSKTRQDNEHIVLYTA